MLPTVVLDEVRSIVTLLEGIAGKPEVTLASSITTELYVPPSAGNMLGNTDSCKLSSDPPEAFEVICGEKDGTAATAETMNSARQMTLQIRLGRSNFKVLTLTDKSEMSENHLRSFFNSGCGVGLRIVGRAFESSPCLLAK